VDPFLASLNPRERTAYPFIRQGVREGLSSRQIMTVLQEHLGAGLRRQRLLELMRLETLEVNTGATLRYLRLDSTPNPARLPDALTRIRRNYSFDVEVRGSLLDTGEPYTRYVTVTTDDLMTRGSLEAAGMDAVEIEVGRYGMTAESALLVGGRRAGSQGHF